MRKRRSEGCARGSGARLLIVGVSCLTVLALDGCQQVDGLVELEDVLERNQLKYESAELSEASLKKRMKEIDDAYADPRFNPDADARTGFRTRCLLAIPVLDHEGRVFGVAEALNKNGGALFTAEDERQFRRFTESLAVILETWWQLGHHHAGERP